MEMIVGIVVLSGFAWMLGFCLGWGYELKRSGKAIDCAFKRGRQTGALVGYWAGYYDGKRETPASPKEIYARLESNSWSIQFPPGEP